VGSRCGWIERSIGVLDIKEIVMAKVIEFYMPKNFRKPLRTAAQPQLGKIIEFCPQTKRSA
jgi:hypothetical protein